MTHQLEYKASFFLKSVATHENKFLHISEVFKDNKDVEYQAKNVSYIHTVCYVSFIYISLISVPLCLY